MFPENSSAAADIQRRLDRLLDHLPAGVVVHAADGRILSVNRLARELLERGEAELVGSQADASTWRFVGTDKQVMPQSAYPVNMVLRTLAKVQNLIVGVPSKLPESLRWLICNAYPEFDEEQHLQQVVVCFTDCTPLKRAKQQLEKSEERLRLVLRGSTDASWDWDLAAGDIYYSDRWWEMLGYAPGALPSDPELWLRLVHPDDEARLREFVGTLFADRREVYGVEFRLRHRDGHYVPVLSRGFVLRDLVGRPLRIAGTNTDLTERKEAERRIHELSNFDQLTSLPNRSYLIGEMRKILARSGRSGQVGAIFSLDLDHFRLINDSLGIEAGDSLLRQVADRLRDILPPSAQVARAGADEFVIVMEGLGRTAREAVAEASQAARRLLEVLEKPYVWAGSDVRSTASIGVTVFDAAATDIDTVLKQAALAMNEAKAHGRHGLRFFDSRMQAAADLQAGLEKAIHGDGGLRQFVLYCQPQFSRHGRLIGGEVLVRWRRPDGELLGPDEFIGLAESSGLILPLGQHVLEQSCRLLGRWRRDKSLCKLKLGVNVSVHQLRDPGFPDSVAAILADTGAPAGRLCLELTESVFAEDMMTMTESMQRLRMQGIHFSLDDFGTGYSSLAYLKRFPLAGLKIDRSFVHDAHIDPNAVPIIKAIIALARTLKLDIVAEGVEHEAQRKFLAERGCYALQGYLLGRPVPIEEFEQAHRAPEEA